MENLRVGHRLARGLSAVAWDVRRLKRVNPLVGGARSDALGYFVEQSASCVFVPRPAPVAHFGVGRDEFRHAKRRRRNVHEAGVYAAELYPLAVGALEHAVKRAAALRGHVHSADGDVRALDFGRVQQRARHERGCHAPAAPRPLAPIERRRDSKRRQQPRADVCDGVDDVYRSFAPTRRLARQYPRSGGDEIVVGGLVRERTVRAIRRYRAVDEIRAPRARHVQPKPRARRGRWREIFKQNVRARENPPKPARAAIAVVRVDADDFLAPVIEREDGRIANGVFIIEDDPNDPRAVVRQKHGTKRGGKPARQIRDRQPVKRGRPPAEKNIAAVGGVMRHSEGYCVGAGRLCQGLGDSEKLAKGLIARARAC